MGSRREPVTPDGSPPFDARISQVAADTVHVAVRGEIDLATRDCFAHVIGRAWGCRPTTMVVDLTAVTFLSASGAAVLAAAREEAVANGVTVSIVSRPGIVHRVMAFADDREVAEEPPT